MGDDDSSISHDYSNHDYSSHDYSNHDHSHSYNNHNDYGNFSNHGNNDHHHHSNNDHNDHNPAATHVTTGISGANSSESQTNSAAVAKDAIMSGFERAINACNGNSDCITAAAKKAEELAAKSSLGDENRGIKTEIEREVHTSVSPS